MGNKRWRLWPRRKAEFTADAEEVQFSGLFRQLFLWYTSLLTIFFALLILSIGSTVPWLVFVSTEYDLSNHISQLAQEWQTNPASVCPLSLPGSGYMLACYNPQGTLLNAQGVPQGPERHFLDNTLVQSALHEQAAQQDALDHTGTEQAQFFLTFLTSGEVRILRQAVTVYTPDSRQIVGVVQLGTRQGETMQRRAVIVDVFLVCMFLTIITGAPGGGWYLARRSLRPTRLAFQRQKDFIANVSHELGTPLALIRANADVLLRNRSRLANEDVELLEDIVAEAVYMDKMTENMLLLARMDTGQLHLEHKILRLGELAEGMVRRTRPLAERAGITLFFQQEEEAYVEGDQALLEQATLILLDNAIKYTPKGGSVHVYVFKNDGLACLRVSDTGMGIAAEALPRLGERFYRVDKARSREQGGNGLGLSIARGILAAHHGRLTLQSEVGKGTDVTLFLPVH